MNSGIPLPPGAFQWLTPAAPAAIAVFWCPPVEHLLDRSPPAPGVARFARLQMPDGRAVDEVVALRLDPGVLEVQCHGGPGMRAAVEGCLQAHGLQASTDELVDPVWSRVARVAHSAALPLVLGQEALPPAFPEDLLYRAPLVLITGPSNAGKSSLLNAWCGHGRALVDAQAGTTRDLVWAEVEVDGWRLRLCDSAGLRTGADALEQAGQELVAQARARADLVLWLQPADASAAGVTPQPDDLVVCGKADLLPDGGEAGAPRWAAPPHVDRDQAEALLQVLGRCVLARLGLRAP
ncbi:MAG: GTPase [Planctomycetota bacterium]